MSDALAGKRVINTRAVEQAAALDEMLRARGAQPIAYPCIAISPPEETDALDAALLELAAGRYDWLLLASANSAFALAKRMRTLGLRLERRLHCAAVGPATAETARRELGLEGIAQPKRYTAESLAEHLPLERGARVLLPNSEIAPPTVAELLRARGANVTVVHAYRTECGQGGADVPGMLAAGSVDALALTSTSTVQCFLRRLAAEGGEAADLQAVCIACIGPQTADAARDAGLTVAVVAEEQTLEGLVEALDGYFAREMRAAEVRRD